MRLAWTIFYSLLLVNTIAFATILFSLKPFWVDINDFIVELTGISIHWAALVLVLTAFAILFTLFLL